MLAEIPLKMGVSVFVGDLKRKKYNGVWLSVNGNTNTKIESFQIKVIVLI